VSDRAPCRLCFYSAARRRQHCANGEVSVSELATPIETRPPTPAVALMRCRVLPSCQGMWQNMMMKLQLTVTTWLCSPTLHWLTPTPRTIPPVHRSVVSRHTPNSHDEPSQHDRGQRGSAALCNGDTSSQWESSKFNDTRQNAEQGGSAVNGDNLLISIGPTCGSVITVGLGLGFGLGFGVGLRIVVYKLLEKVTKCGYQSRD